MSRFSVSISQATLALLNSEQHRSLNALQKIGNCHVETHREHLNCQDACFLSAVLQLADVNPAQAGQLGQIGLVPSSRHPQFSDSSPQTHADIDRHDLSVALS